MNEVIAIGLDIAKHGFQVHGVNETGTVVIRRELRRVEGLQFFEGSAPCLVGMKACGRRFVEASRSWRWGIERR